MTDQDDFEIGPLNMVIAIDRILEPFNPGDVIIADTFTALVDSLCPGYMEAEEDEEQLHLRAIAMSRIAAKLQAAHAVGAQDLPEWVTERNFLDEVEIDQWDHECPLVVIADAQTNVPVPEGNVVVLSIRDERLFIASLIRAELIRLFEGPDED